MDLVQNFHMYVMKHGGFSPPPQKKKKINEIAIKCLWCKLISMIEIIETCKKKLIGPARNGS